MEQMFNEKKKPCGVALRIIEDIFWGDGLFRDAWIERSPEIARSHLIKLMGL
jgi:hypothetical protein